jgi:hypothetical protein
MADQLRGINMQKCALFAFNGESMCFIHVLVNALDMKQRGYKTVIILEGAATRMILDLAQEGNHMASLYQKAKSLGLIGGACKACSTKMGVLDAIKREGIPVLDEMSGHASMTRYLEEGFEVITF